MKHSDGRFPGAAGHSIYFQCWEPESAPSAVLMLVHGAGEHSGRYLPLASYFAGNNFVVAAFDQNGHGYSDGTPGHVNAFDDYLYDLGVFRRQVAERFVGVPVFLLGHSMGGLVAANYLLRNQDEFVGAILSGAAIMTDLQPGLLQLWAIRLLAVLAPKMGLLQLDANGVSRDPQQVRRYVEDPLVHHGKLSARFVRELFVGMRALQDSAGVITVPMLILHGGADTMTAPRGSQFLYEAVGSTDKTLKIYPGVYHEIFNEPERAEILAEVLKWCDGRLATD
ncbi:MAG: alpha/beta hydrolase [Halioglobus sp.]